MNPNRQKLRGMIILPLLMLITIPAQAIYIPQDLNFCDTTVPLDASDVLERLEVQLRILSRNTGQVELWMKRQHRYFPVIEPKLSAAGVPMDLKYVPVIESSLLSGAISSKSAVGPWQFIAQTGRNNGLRVNRWVDDRRDTSRSTDAAIRYLKSLYAEFNFWPTAMAAYNIGENRIRKEVYRQGTADYFEMLLPDETDRYVLNIIAAKIILEHPSEFHINPAEITAFSDLPVSPVSISLTTSLPVKLIAHAAGMTYREFRTANPWCIGVELPKGKYSLSLAQKHRMGFESRIEEYRQRIKNRVKFRSSITFTVTAESGEMRIGPGFTYPVFRRLPNKTKFAVKSRTGTKEKSHYWYRFVQSNGAEGWIWGGQISR
jgi:peptidoglycan lytic transglycosylase D